MPARPLPSQLNVQGFNRPAAQDLQVPRAWPADDGWLVLSMTGALVVTSLDLLLIERRFGVFSGGFLAETPLTTMGQKALFVGLSLLADLAAIGIVAGVLLWLARKAGLAPVARRFLAFVVGIAPLTVYDLVSYQLLSYLGSSFDISLMFDLVGHRLSEIFAVTAAHLIAPAGLLVAAVGGTAVVTWQLHQRYPAGREERASRAPRMAAWLLLPLTVTAILTTVRAESDQMQNALRRKGSAQAMAVVVGRLTDVDRDGAGVGARPRDTAPFDARIHPYAVDVPGNGIDENGVAGDLPLNRVTAPAAASATVWNRRPDVVVVLLESVRGDAVGASERGRPVTPVLDRLGAEGVSTAHAYSHNGFTYQSRYHLFTGRLTAGGDGTSLIDDFKANGYRVGYFSGQDDSFGGPELSVGFERADAFFDARQAADQRYTQFSTPGSLAVPGAIVTQRALDFVRTTDRQTPLFLYVNYHDTHFPYHHSGIQALIGDTVLPQSAISPERGADIRSMYLNTLANVDREIGALLSEVASVRQRAPGVIVTSDHGESLFEQDFLGHGYALNEAQTRVPLVVANLPLTLSEPVGHVDIRPAIQQALAGGDTVDRRPRLAASPGGTTFQYLGSQIDRPRQIGFVSNAGRTIYDFRTGLVQFPHAAWEKPERLTTEATAAFLDLVHRWENLMWAEAR